MTRPECSLRLCRRRPLRLSSPASTGRPSNHRRWLSLSTVAAVVARLDRATQYARCRAQPSLQPSLSCRVYWVPRFARG
jgi:hypothetical protein